MRVFYGSVIVGTGALMTCVAIRAVFSLAVFLEPMSTATGWSRTGISSAAAGGLNNKRAHRLGGMNRR